MFWASQNDFWASTYMYNVLARGLNYFAPLICIAI